MRIAHYRYIPAFEKTNVPYIHKFLNNYFTDYAVSEQNTQYEDPALLAMISELYDALQHGKTTNLFFFGVIRALASVKRHSYHTD